MIELLSPAGDLEKLKFACLYGADAIYFGGRNFGLRANAKNFSNDEIISAVKYAHHLHKKVYVTVNIIFHDEDFKGLEDYLKFLDQANVDAIIASDISVMSLWHDLHLKTELNVSTQASTLNKETALFYKQLGASRVILARESMENDIIGIKKETALDLETFIHGAMCTSFSGRCIMSNYATNRDANRGGCAQICRWFFPIVNEDKNLEIAPKDLNMIPYIGDMINAGVNSFKIEGRMRSIYYIATVLLCYRRIIDHYLHNTLTSEYTNYYLQILNRCANRESTPQFFKKFPGEKEQYYLSNEKEVSNQDFLGLVIKKERSLVTIEQRNYFKVNDIVQFFGPNHATFEYQIKEIFDEDMHNIENANHAQMIVKLPISEALEPGDMMRIKVIDICDDL